MQRNIYTDDFERLIRQKADQYKMYPSDQVWKGVYKSLHGRRRWRWAGLVIFLVGIGVYTGDWYISDKPAGQIAKNIQPSISAANQDFSKIPSSTAPFHWVSGNGISGNPVNSIRSTQLSAATGVTNQPGNTVEESYNSIVSFPDESMLIINNPLEEETTTSDKVISGQVQQPTLAEKADEHPAKAAALETAETPSIITLTENTSAGFADAASESVLGKDKLQNVNWLQEYAVFRLTPSRPKRIGLQLYFSPTINYRKLSGSSYFTTSELKSIPLSPNIMGDVDQFVKHKPALGFELGSNLLYRSSKRITFKAGLQFNYSRYNIEAYSSPPEIATIALNNAQAFVADTISTYSRFRNLSGYAPEDLSNQYFQLSMPVGLEFRVMGTEKLQLNVAGTIQPTYLLNKNSYLITTDYKNYMREPSLVRRWNVNGGVEAYVSYHTGTVRWQVGPQFRYQLLSTYVRKYPIKEQLMEYGFKVGVSKTLR